MLRVIAGELKPTKVRPHSSGGLGYFPGHTLMDGTVLSVTLFKEDLAELSAKLASLDEQMADTGQAYPEDTGRMEELFDEYSRATARF